ncbi:MAG TPA: methylenetetrahydrofolate reductase [Candidatus Nanoarchaeia archaeon]|nr:methylenetetrahydrofolate reductase [Candidatus Nanoarchaeia archaeon]
MKVHRLYNGHPILSVEIMPRRIRSLGGQQAQSAEEYSGLVREISKEADFVTITSSGNASLESNIRSIDSINAYCAQLPVYPHLTLMNKVKEGGRVITRRNDTENIFESIALKGIESFIIIRGDVGDDVKYHIDCYGFLQDARETFPDHSIGIACHPEGHPESISLDSDLQNFMKKAELADFALTQIVLDTAIYEKFRERFSRTAQNSIPIIPEIFIFYSHKNFDFLPKIGRITIPEGMRERFARYDEEDVKEAGKEFAIELGNRFLRAGVPGLHIVSMNDLDLTLPVLKELAKSCRYAA